MREVIKPLEQQIQALHHVITNLEIKEHDVEASVVMLDSTRQMLATIDQRLNECHSVLSGYDKYVKENERILSQQAQAARQQQSHHASQEMNDEPDDLR